MKRFNTLKYSVLAVFFALTGGMGAWGATYSWTGGGGVDTSWTNPSNWGQVTNYPGISGNAGSDVANFFSADGFTSLNVTVSSAIIVTAINTLSNNQNASFALTFSGTGSLTATSMDLYRPAGASAPAAATSTTTFDLTTSCSGTMTIHSGANITIAAGKTATLAAITNTGSSSPAETVTVNGTISLSGAYNIDDGRSLSVNSGGTVSGAGTIAVSGTGSIINNGTISCSISELTPSYTWTGGAVDGLWVTAGNWKKASGATATVPPGSSDTAIFNSTPTVTISIDTSIGNLSITNGSSLTLLTSNKFTIGSASIAGDFVAGTGEVAVTGTFTVTPSGSYTGTSGAFNAATLANNGAFTTGSGDITVTALTNAGRIVASSTANISVSGTATLSSTAGAPQISTAGGKVTFSSGVVLSADTTISTGTGAGDIIFSSTVTGNTTGAEDLTLSAGTGAVSFTGAVGGTQLGALAINSASGGITANSTIAATSVSLTGGPVDLNGAVTAPGGFSSTGTSFDNTGASITTTANPISIIHTGALTVGAALSSTTGATTVRSTGSTVAISSTASITTTTGAITLDSQTSTLGLSGAVNTASGTILVDAAGTTTITATGDITATGAANISFGATRAGTVATEGDVTTAGGAIRFYRAVQLTGNVAFDTTNAGGTAAGANILFDGAITRDGTARTLGLRAGTGGNLQLAGDIGTSTATTYLGAITITSANNVAGDNLATPAVNAGSIYAASLTQSAGSGTTRLGPVTTTGATSITGVIVTANGVIAADGGFSSSGTGIFTSGSSAAITATGSNSISISTTGASSIITVGATLTTATGNVTLRSNDGAIALNAGIATASGAIAIDGAGTTTVAAAGDIAATGAATVAFGANETGTVATEGDVTTAGGAIRFYRAVQLTGNVAFDTTNTGGTAAGANILFDGAITRDGTARTLGLRAGTGGNLQLAGAIGTSTATTYLGAITITSANNVAGDNLATPAVNAGSIYAASLTQSAGSGTTRLGPVTTTGATSITGVIVTANGVIAADGGFSSSGTGIFTSGSSAAITATGSNAISISTTGASSIITVGATLTTNSGNVTLRSNDGAIALNAGIATASGAIAIDGAGTTTVAAAGDIAATGAATVAFGANETGTVATEGDVTTAGGAIRFYRAVQLTGNVAFDTTNAGGTAAGANILFDGAITRDGTARTLGLRAGTGGNLQLVGDIGTSTATTYLGAITITSANNVAGDNLATPAVNAGSVYAASFTQSAGSGTTRLGPVTTTGATSITGVIVTANGVIAADGGFSSSGTGIFTSGSSAAITATGSNSISISTTGASSIITVGATLTTNSGNVTLRSNDGAIALNAGIATASGAIAIDGAGTTTVAAAGDIAATGAATVAFGANETGTVATEGDVTTAGGAIRFYRAVQLTGNVAFDTTNAGGTAAGANILFDGAITRDGTARTLGLRAGTGGNLQLAGAIGTSTATTYLGAITITSANNVAGDNVATPAVNAGSIYAASLTQSAGSGTTRLGSVTTTGIQSITATAIVTTGTHTTTGADITFTGPVTLGANTAIYTSDGAVSFSTTASTINATTDISQGLSVSSGTGTITLSGVIGGIHPLSYLTLDTTTTGTTTVPQITGISALNMYVNGPVTQSAVITGTGLHVKTRNDSGADITLTLASNDFDYVAFETRNTLDNGDAAGDIAYRDTDDVCLGKTTTTTVLCTGNTSIRTTAGGSATITAGGAVTQQAPILTGALSLNGAGYYTLTNTSNACSTIIAALTGSTQNLSYTDTDGLTIGDGSNGISTNNGSVTIVSNGGSLTVTNAIATGTAPVSLTSAGTDLTVNIALSVSGTGTITLDGSGAASTIAINAALSAATGAITVNSTGVASLSATGDITTTTGSVNFGDVRAGTVATEGDVTTAGGAIRFYRAVQLTGNVAFDTTNAGGTAAGANILFDGAITRDGTARTLGLRAGTGGNLQLAGDIGTSTATTYLGAITITSANNVAGDNLATPAVNAGSVYAASFTQSAGSGTTRLGPVTTTGATSITGVIVTANGVIAADGGFSSSGTGIFTSGSSAAITATGSNSISISTTGASSIITVGATLTTATGNVTLRSNDGAIALNAGIATASGAIAIDGAGTTTVAAAGDIAATGAATVAFGANETGTVATEGDVTTAGGAIRFYRAVQLTGNVAFDTTNTGGTAAGANILFDGAITRDGTARTLGLRAGTGGNLQLAGAIGTSTATTYLGAITITSANNVAGDNLATPAVNAGSIYAASLTQSAGSGTTRLGPVTTTGATSITGVIVTANGVIAADGGFSSSGTGIFTSGSSAAITATGSNAISISTTGASSIITVGATLTTNSGNVTLRSNDGAIALNAGIATASGAIAIDGAGTTTVAAAGDIAATGAATVAFGANETGTVATEGDVTTAGGAIRFYRAVQLTGNVAFDTTNAGGTAAGANILFDGAITRDGTARTLGLRAGTGGNLQLVGDIGTSTATTYLGAITITSANNVAGDNLATPAVNAGSVYAASFTQSAGSGTTRLGPVTTTGATSITGVIVTANGVIAADGGFSSSGTGIFTSGSSAAITATGSNSISISTTGASSIITVGATLTTNSGNVTLRSNDGAIALNAGIATASGAIAIDGAGTTTVAAAGDIAATGAATVAFGANETGTVATEGDVTTAGGAIRFYRAVQLTGNVAFDTTNAGGTAAGANILFDGAITRDGTARTLGLRAGTGGNLQLAGAIGTSTATTYLGAITITSANNVAGDNVATPAVNAGSIYAASLTQSAGSGTTRLGSVTTTGIQSITATAIVTTGTHTTTGADITFTGPVTLGANTAIYTSDGAVSFSTTASTINATTDISQGLSVSSGTGTITLSGVIGGIHPLSYLTLDTTTTGTTTVPQITGISALNMYVNGPVTQSAVITGTGLHVKTRNDSGADITLTLASNDFDYVAFETRNTLDNGDAAGDIAYRDTDDVCLGKTTTTTVLCTGNTSIRTTAGGSATITAGGAVTQQAPILTGALSLNGAGYYTLTNTSNACSTIIAALTGSTQNLSYTDTDGLTIGDGSNGISTNNGSVTIVSNGGSLTVTNAIATGTAPVSLTSAGTDLTVNIALSVSGTGTITLDGSGAASTIAINAALSAATGAITVNSTGVASLSATGDITTTTGSVNFGDVRAGTVATEGDVTTAGGAIRFYRAVQLTGNVAFDTTNAGGTAAGANILFDGAITRDGTARTLGLRAGTGGNLQLAGDIGTSTATTYLGAITITSANNVAGDNLATPAVNAGSVYAASFTQSAGSGTTRLGPVTTTGATSITGVIVTANGVIAADGGFSSSGTGIFTSGSSAAITATGSNSISISTTGASSIITVGATLTTATGNVTLRSNDGAIALNAGIATASGAIAIDGAGTTTVAAAGDIAATGAATVAFGANETGTVATEGDVTTAGGAVSFKRDILINADITIDTTNGGSATAGANIEFAGALTRSTATTHSIAVTSGTGGNTTFSSTAGSATYPLTSLTIGNALTVTFDGAVYATNGVRMTMSSGTPSLTSSGTITLSSTDLYLDHDGATLTLGANLSCRNLYFYRGSLSMAGRTVTTAADFAVFGNFYSPIDADWSASNTRFAYYGAGSLAYYPAGGTYATGAFSTGTSAVFSNLNSSTLSVGGNFYDNGANMTGASGTPVSLSLTGSATATPTLNGTAAVTATQWGTPYAVAFSMTATYVNASGRYVAAASPVAASSETNQNVTDGGNNASWQFMRPEIKATTAKTMFDNVIYIEFVDQNGSAIAMENSNDEIYTAMVQLFCNTAGTNYAFTGAFIDANCATITTGQGDLTHFYIQTTNTTWNTDATGSSAGLGASTNRSGTNRSIIADIGMLRGALRAANGYTMCRAYAKTTTPTFAAFTGTTDACRPVLVSVAEGQAAHMVAAQTAYDAHNYLTLTWSEPVDIGSLLATDTNVQSTVLFDATDRIGGHISATAGGALTVSGYFTEAGLSGAITTNMRTDATGITPARTDSSNGLWRTANSLTIYLAGYAMSISGYTSADSWPWYWPGYVDAIASPAGQTITVLSNSYITDTATTPNAVEPTVNDNLAYGPTTAAGTYAKAAVTVAAVGNGWDVHFPDVAAYRPLTTTSTDAWDDPIDYYEANPGDTNSDTLIDRVEFHVFDDIKTDDTTTLYTAAWAAAGNPVWISTDPKGWYVSNSLSTAAPDVSGGIRDSSFLTGVSGSDVTYNSSAFSFKRASDASYTASYNDASTPFITSVQSVFFNASSVNTVDDPYFSLIMATPWRIDSELEVHYSGYITDLAGLRLKDLTDYPCINKTPPEISMTIQPLNATSLYIAFSKKVYLPGLDTALSVQNTTAGAVTLSFTTAPTVGENGKSIILNMSRALTMTEILDCSLGSDGTIRDTFDNYMDSASTHRITDVGVNVVETLYASDGVNTDSLLGGSGGALRTFDGTGRLLDKDITISSQLNPGNNPATATADTLLLYYDVNPSESYYPTLFNDAAGKNLKLWLPTILPAFNTVANSDARSISAKVIGDYAGNSVSGDMNIQNFILSSNDSEIATGAKVEFIFKYGNLFCARLTDPGDITSLDPWRFSISAMKLQRGGVTILNNVIDSNKKERTLLSVNLEKAGTLTIEVFTMDGNIVRTLERGKKGAGTYSFYWDGTNLAGNAVARGIYFIRIVGPDMDEIRKVMVVKE